MMMGCEVEEKMKERDELKQLLFSNFNVGSVFASSCLWMSTSSSLTRETHKRLQHELLQLVVASSVSSNEIDSDGRSWRRMSPFVFRGCWWYDDAMMDVFFILCSFSSFLNKDINYDTKSINSVLKVVRAAAEGSYLQSELWSTYTKYIKTYLLFKTYLVFS